MNDGKINQIELNVFTRSSFFLSNSLACSLSLSFSRFIFLFSCLTVFALSLSLFLYYLLFLFSHAISNTICPTILLSVCKRTRQNASLSYAVTRSFSTMQSHLLTLTRTTLHRAFSRECMRTRAILYSNHARLTQMERHFSVADSQRTSRFRFVCA